MERSLLVWMNVLKFCKERFEWCCIILKEVMKIVLSVELFVWMNLVWILFGIEMIIFNYIVIVFYLVRC